jgi:hypothetical protein
MPFFCAARQEHAMTRPRARWPVDINKVIHRKYELLVNTVKNQIVIAHSACKKSALETFC